VSGFAGVVDWGRRNSAAGLARRMAAFLENWGPDRQSIATANTATLVFTQLSTDAAAPPAALPLTLDDGLVITGDLRLDGRDQLARAFDLNPHTPESLIVLHAWRAWGPRMMRRVRGEFAFAIWDEPTQTLFAVRDPLGTRPFYYAVTPGAVIFSNSLDCVRLHPDVDDGLDEPAVADFLLFGCNQNPASTTYRDVRRLPPGHFALFRNDSTRVERYWSLPEDEPLSLATEQEYMEECCRVLRSAVGERMPQGTLGLLMSGGLDSTAMAAIARDEGGVPASEIHAFTSALRSREADGEARHATLAVSALGLTHHLHWDDDELVDPDWLGHPVVTPEPCESPLALRFERRRFAEIARWSRVVFFGEGPDNALFFEPAPQLRWLLSSRGVAAALTAILRHARVHRRIPMAGFPGGLLEHLGRRTAHPAPYPSWLQPEFESNCGLRERWENSHHPETSAHRWRPRAAASFDSPLWDDMLTKFDPAWTGAPLEFRHPYLDERVLRLFLQLPAMPWCREKLILRRALKGLLPEAILRWKKTPLRGEPEHEILKRAGFPPLRMAEGLDRFVNPSRMPASPGSNPQQFWLDLRAYALNIWLSSRRSMRAPNVIQFDRKEDYAEASGASPSREAARPLYETRIDEVRNRH
jgi:asparagine synthase (glutamine-hydrolysing)